MAVKDITFQHPFRKRKAIFFVEEDPDGKKIELPRSKHNPTADTVSPLNCYHAVLLVINRSVRYQYSL